MDTPITRAEHEEFCRRMDEENHRQNRRIEALEQNVEKLSALTTAVERLATNMESMLREQERQGKRLGVLENRDEISSLNVTMERLNATMENALATQKQQGKRLETLESRDGEMWRKVLGYIATAIIGIVIGFIFHQLGM